jgi:signal transduction histidine kinase
VAAAAAWSLLVFALAGWGLSELYRQSVMRGLDADLSVDIDDLLATVEADATGVRAPNPPNDRRYTSAYSGRYWRVSELAKTAPAPLRSESLWDVDLPLTPAMGRSLTANMGKTVFFDAPGPRAQRLRIAGVAVKLDAIAAPVAVLVAADRKPTEADAGRFTATLLVALGVLASGLVAAVFLQVRVGLAPLNLVRLDVSDVRRGRKARLDGDYPVEVAPLTAELNALLDHNREVVERARTHVGNLAHALKTPISVLLNEARANTGPLAELVARQSEGMARNVEHYLQRAQAAARAEALGARTPVRPVLEDISRTLERLYGREKDIEIVLDAPRDAVFRGERQDLEEMAGNLMDNACKYGASRVVARLIAPERGADPLEIVIDDDGPGLSPEDQEVALKRGARLDESSPGQGLGLSIIDELSRAYGGRLSFGRADIGGLRAILSLPTTE